MNTSKTGFAPITKDKFIESYLKRNAGDNRGEIEEGIDDALEYYRKGKTCSCGNPIWVVGSAISGAACFTCITGESKPDGDFEIDEAL